MKKQLFLTLALTFLTIVISANPVSKDKALRIANCFWQVMGGKNTPLSWAEKSALSPFNEFYIFCNEAGPGFVLVASDDCVQPILGFSTDADFTFPIPANAEWFMNMYEEEIAYCKSNHIAATEDIAALWNDLYNYTFRPALRSAVSPMLTTTWNQDAPYNDLCPFGGIENVPAGCTAIATAQVMKYWNWPESGVGSNSYVHDLYGLQSADFANTTYDWANMPNRFTASSTDTQKAAVATLIYHVGIAVNMDYGADGSGAYTEGINWPSAENALRNYFCYSESLHSIDKEKDSIGFDDWMDLLMSELNAGRPIIESGYTSDKSGHAFVCDGYNAAGLFHINWGWGGAADGYFHPIMLNPASGMSFSHNISLIVGIEPNRKLSAKPDCLDFPYEGGTQTLTISPSTDSNQSWTALSDQPWVTLSNSHGGNTPAHQLINVTTSANPNPDLRFANIVITQGGQTDTVVVRQAFDCDTLYYCHGTYHGGQGPESRDSSVYWGIRLDTAKLAHVTTLHTVHLWIRYGGTYHLRIYQGGDNAPDSLVYYDSIVSPKFENWYEYNLPSPLDIDNSKSLWVTFYNEGTESPICGTYYYGEPDGSWLSADGVNWSPLTEGDKLLSWFIRAIVTGDAECENIFTDIYESADGSYTWHGHTYTRTGEYSFVIPDVVGNNCDSVETLHLTMSGLEISTLEDNQIKIYPNPSSGIFTIEGDGIERVEIFNMMGQRMAFYEHNRQINLSSMANGIYLLRITTPEGPVIRQVIKRQ